MTLKTDHTASQKKTLPPGRVDIHSHLLVAVDDGCVSVADAVKSVQTLKAHGYVASICTPHIFPRLYPDNTAENIRAWTREMQQYLDSQQLDYQLWAGGEVRLLKDSVAWFKDHELPTLAGTRYVLTDFWVDRWQRWLDDAYDWLLSEGYKPILAHPERSAIGDLDKHLDDLAARGVLLQGNFRCMTGEDGYIADKRIREYLQAGRYTFLALDMHCPDTLESRLDGIKLVEQEFSRDLVIQTTVTAPRELILADAVC